MSAVTPNAGAGEELDLRELSSRLWKGRRLIAASVVLFTGIAVAAALLIQPVYRATAVVVAANVNSSSPIGPALGSLSGLATIAGIDVGAMPGARTEESIAVLRSREFTERFIADRELMPELFRREWDERAHDWKPSGDKPTLVRGSKRFDELRSIVHDRKTGLVRVALEWPDPVKAAALVNGMIAELNEVMRMRTIQRTDAYLGYLRKELSGTAPVETREAISRLMEAQINERMLANVTEEYTFRVVDKALPPDPLDPARPKKAMLVLFGVLAGMIIGSAAVLVLDAFGRRAGAAPTRHGRP